MKVGHLSVDEEAIVEFCEKWKIAELAVFGSVLRDDFRPDSDVDFLITWKDGAGPHSYFVLFQMRDELASLIRREVDVAERQLLERSYNEFRRAAIFGSAKTIYAAA